MKEYSYIVKEISHSVHGVVILKVGDKNGGGVFDFCPGQYAMISYRGENGRFKSKHAFSISSSPEDKSCLEFGIKILGKFTQGLSRLKAGDEILVSGPHGSFVFNEAEKEVVQIAGGIGITPFISALRYVSDRNLSNRIMLIYSNRTLGGTVFYDELKKLGQENENIRPVFAITDEPVAETEGRMENSMIDCQMIKRLVGDLGEKVFYLCGPAKFMAVMEGNLKSMGVSPARIKKEEFSMAPSLGFKESLKHGLASFSFASGLAFLILYFIYQPPPMRISGAEAAVKKFYSQDRADKINQSAYDRTMSIISAREEAIENQKKGVAKNSSQPTKEKANNTATAASKRPAAAVLNKSDAESLLREFQQLNFGVSGEAGASSVNSGSQIQPASQLSPVSPVSPARAASAVSASPPVSAAAIPTPAPAAVPVPAIPVPTPAPALVSASVPKPIPAPKPTPAPAPAPRTTVS